ncbi:MULTISPECIES: bifunctional GNAT family N-acetyltransferase/GrpB family protein [Bacillus]|uniref:GNAT family N-acetyltransferase n=1 Tax=Bacillus pumilus TaxID=1408 RepID=A0A2G8IWM0_BACPU|nr:MULTISPECIES: bifunctional GNAT family N-acetyltransferase/GrpB family protein [Bacillus]MCC9087678.1 GNAT family N-acetyltransferase [Bacillus pumilus]MED1747990.1 bifunctional GNAT family N-acetyltransferase/GrpB family protein [Bacillus zhangzhouensis]PIK27841.1 GNAT family N-acetyltransferase [Bacillus pumilus]
MIVNLDQTKGEVAKQILHIQLAAYQQEAEQIGYADLPPLKETIQDVMKAKEQFIGFEQKGILLGVASYEEQKDYLIISRLAVHPKALKQGIGTRLMSTIMEKNVPIELTTGQKNTPAKRLYEKLGFLETNVIHVAKELTLSKMKWTPRRKVEVVEFKKEWHEEFHQEKQRLKQIIQKSWIEGHHIGSTSVEGLVAKPIIDILIEVSHIKEIDRKRESFEHLGYQALGENGVKGRRFFQKGGLNRTHHVHVYERNHPDVKRHLLFRDYLRVHPERAASYASVKEQLANQYPEDIQSYMAGKNEIIKEIENEAYHWDREGREEAHK